MLNLYSPKIKIKIDFFEIFISVFCATKMARTLTGAPHYLHILFDVDVNQEKFLIFFPQTKVLKILLLSRPKVGGEPEPPKSDGLTSKYAQTLTKKSCCEFGAVL